jgi:hypothetical protein
MAEFINQKKYPLVVGELEGSVTIPIILEDDDLGIYIENIEASRKLLQEREESGESQGLGIHLKLGNRKHIVKAITFPGLTIDSFRESTAKRPYPAVAEIIVDLIQPLIDDALNIKN